MHGRARTNGQIHLLPNVLLSSFTSTKYHCDELLISDFSHPFSKKLSGGGLPTERPLLFPYFKAIIFELLNIRYLGIGYSGKCQTFFLLPFAPDSFN